MSSPYQSNILRFVVGQYRAGVDRHRRAVMTTQSTVALGVEVGAVLAMTPVYAAVRMSQSAGQKLRQSVMNQRLLEPFSRVVGQLKSAGVGGLVARSQSSMAEDVEQKETVGSGLQAAPVAIYKVISRSAVKAISLVRTAVDWLVPANLVEEDESAIAPSVPQSNIAQSDIVPSDIAPNIVQSGEMSADKAQGNLVWPMRSFWVAVLHAIAHLKSRRDVKKLKSGFAALPENTAKELPSNQSSKRLRSSRVNAMPLPPGKVGGDLRTVSVLEVELEANANVMADSLLDAKVTAFEYVEHPLETVLKWIDRILTWLEGQLQRLLSIWHRWLLRVRNS